MPVKENAANVVQLYDGLGYLLLEAMKATGSFDTTYLTGGEVFRGDREYTVTEMQVTLDKLRDAGVVEDNNGEYTISPDGGIFLRSLTSYLGDTTIHVDQ